MNVKTKNWGPEFKHLSNLFGLKSVAATEHTTNLKAEVAIHDGSHAYGRHGAQTGWEAQMIRACTKITPDQASDPMGLNPTLRRWNSVMSLSDTDGSAVFDLFGDSGNPPETHTTSAGNIAGGFITPEAQFLARKRGEAIAGSLIGPVHYAANYRFKTEKKFARFPLNAIHVVVGSSKPGAPYGLGFSRRDPRNYRDHSHAFVSQCIDGFLTRKTWAQTVPDLSASTFKFNIIALKKNKIAFPEITDLFEFFDLDVLWQGTCSLIYRREHNAGPHTHGPWRLITMFPNSLAAGWSPSLWLSDEAKVKLVAQKMNKNVDDYHWTGLTTSFAGNLKQTYPVPPW
jgi:hypothetical protein